VTLKERLSQETTAALKAGQKVRLAALRLLSAAVKNREVELRRELSDDEFLEVAAKQVKQRRESIEAFEAAGRTELADREREEEAVLSAYLPEPLGDDELDAIVEEAIATAGATGPGDLGKVMGAVMARVKGRADGRTVQAKVRDRLGAG
jgi:uncharacterized protein YqeY